MADYIKHVEPLTNKQILLIHHISQDTPTFYNRIARSLKPVLSMGKHTTFAEMVQTVQSWGFENNYIIKLVYDEKLRNYFPFTKFVPYLKDAHVTQYIVKIEMSE